MVNGSRDRRGTCMVDLTGTCLDLITNMICFVTKPLSLVQVVLLLGVRSVFFVTLAWWRLVNLIIGVHVNLCWQIMVCSVAFLTLPIRILTALERERKLERLLSEMQIQLESLIWENKELEERLQMAVKDRRVIGTLLQEIEEENEKAFARIDLLENEDLKEENMQLNESQGKTLWSCKSCDDKDGNVHDGMPLGTRYGVPSWSPSYNESGMNPQLHGDSWWAGKEGKPWQQDLFRVCGSCSLPHQVASSNTMMDESLERQRVVALYRSLFSAILSLLVGMIIWEAEDPCLPLVAALFTVVGMSLNSVVRFFSTIKNKPASDAVALLSLNWFILGALTYPTLPSVARMLAPQAIKFADQVVSWLGYSS
ncbi:uncharacterized protein [Elaeis guineensis]|uniref:Uncharacterized protein LOC105060840 isoform X2 n=1 Tax=Elaeis guineensis var. tenera TaxID=51953 RepID=A0A6I9SGP4_ELAGV|nr:uncharacterized protein LOC105060840 isoform X2 [Elaeis guineensis]